MTTEEFSNMFDTLLNSYNTSTIFGMEAAPNDIVLDEYEKSVLLTEAQDIIIKQYFTGVDPVNGGFDNSTRRQIDFSSLIKIGSGNSSIKQNNKYDEHGVIFEMPKDILFVLNEKVKYHFSNEKIISLTIIPINYKEYDRHQSKAYNLPLKKQAWRLYSGKNNSNVDIYSEIIIPYKITGNTNYLSNYKIRYIRRPNPIVLTDLNGTNPPLEINGVSQKTECELNPIIHIDILNKAIELAISTRGNRYVPQQQQQQKEE